MPAALRTNTGYTLVELFVAVFLAGVAVSLILGIYTVTTRIFNRYNARIEVNNELWRHYAAVQRFLSGAVAVTHVSGNDWIARDGKGSVSALSYRGARLRVEDTVVRWDAKVDSFSLSLVDSAAGMPVWQCSMTCSKGKEKAGMLWRAVIDREPEDAAE